MTTQYQGRKPPITCQICNDTFNDLKEFSYHLRKHGISSKEYTNKYYYDGTRPLCSAEHCENETRYIRFTYKKYCKDHSSFAESEAGKRGGKAQAWNKGKTKESDPRILKHVHYGEKNGFFGKKHTVETKIKISKNRRVQEEVFNERIISRSNEFEVITKHEEYFSRQHQYLEMICKECGTQQKKTLQAFERGSRCIKCYPYITSIGETEIVQFVRDLGFEVIQSERKLISPKEIDISVSEKTLGIEYNGLYWHMEGGGKTDLNNFSHREKMELCKEVGVNLIQIFSDEWLEKQEIVKSIIKNKLGIADRKIGARKCECRSLSTKEARNFFDKNHISGYTRSKVKFGLFYDNELVCAIALRKPNHNKYKESIEISRFATSLNTQVQGGFSKLLGQIEKWSISNGYKSIVTYADLRFGTGKVYEKCGFDFVLDTGINFWYTDGSTRYDRFKFRAQPGKPEKQVAKENGVYRIYGCGNYLYERKL